MVLVSVVVVLLVVRDSDVVGDRNVVGGGGGGGVGVGVGVSVGVLGIGGGLCVGAGGVGVGGLVLVVAAAAAWAFACRMGGARDEDMFQDRDSAREKAR